MIVDDALVERVDLVERDAVNRVEDFDTGVDLVDGVRDPRLVGRIFDTSISSSLEILVMIKGLSGWNLLTTLKPCVFQNQMYLFELRDVFLG